MAENQRNPDETPTQRLRELDWDRYIGHLYLPAARRDDVNVLAAFTAEMNNLSFRINEPAMGDIRLRWWIEQLSGEGDGEVAGASALKTVLTRRGLPISALTALIEAHQFDFYNDLFPTTTEYEAYAGATESVPLQLCSQMIDSGEAGSLNDLCGHAGVAITVSRNLINLAATSARGRLYLPQDLLTASGAEPTDFFTAQPTPAACAAIETFAEFGLSHLKKSETAAEQLPSQMKPVFLKLAVLRAQLSPYLDRRHYLSNGQLKNTGPSKLRKLWQIWRAARRNSTQRY